MSLNFEEEKRRLTGIRAGDLGETRLTLTPFFAAFRFAWANWRSLLRIGWPLLLAVLVVSLTFEPLLGIFLAGFPTVADYAGAAAVHAGAIAINVGAAAILAVAVHRWIVFDTPPPPEIYFYFRFRRVERKFVLLIMGWWLAFVVTVTLVLIPATLSGGVVSAVTALFSGHVTGARIGGYLAFVAVMMVVAWLAIRTCLVFPHLAATERFDWRLAWRAMGDKFWPALLIIILTGTVFTLLGLALTLPFKALGVVSTIDPDCGLYCPPPPKPPAILIVLYKSLQAILWGFSETVWVALLSYSYREVIQAEQHIPEPPDPGQAQEGPVEIDSKTWTG